jgi:hypothetical protein
MRCPCDQAPLSLRLLQPPAIRTHEGLSLSRKLGMGLFETWATAALGELELELELELGLGDAAGAAGHFEYQQELLRGHRITDPDLSPAAEIADAYTTLARSAWLTAPDAGGGQERDLRVPGAAARTPGVVFRARQELRLTSNRARQARRSLGRKAVQKLLIRAY